MRQVLIAFCAVLLLAACSDETPDHSSVKLPLRVEVRQHGTDYAWFLNDGTEPTTDRAIQRAMRDYAKLEDADSGLPGISPDGVSENLVVFQAPFNAPGKYFGMFLELAVSSMLWRTRLELLHDGKTPLSVKLDLPKDEGLSSAPPDELLELRVNQRDLVVEYGIGLWKEKSQAPSTVTLNLGEFASDWNEPLYRSTCDQLAEAMIAKEGGAKIAPEAVWLALDFETLALWGAVFLALDAVDVANGKRGSADKWPVTVMSPALLSPPPEELPEHAPSPFPKAEELPVPESVRPRNNGE